MGARTLQLVRRSFCRSDWLPSGYSAGVRSAMPAANAIPHRVRRIRTLSPHDCAWCSSACAAPATPRRGFSLGEFTIRIPDTFQGSRTSSSMAGMVNHVFRFPPMFRWRPLDVRHQGRRHGDACRDQTVRVAGISRTQANKMVDAAAGRRTEFRAERPHEIKLAGRPAIAIAWSGKLNGMTRATFSV